MTRLNKIDSLILDIQRTRPGIDKKEKIISLIDYVEQINEDIKEIRENLKHPYLNENKVIHALLEIQIQARLMQIGEARSFHEMAVYLFNIRMLIDNAVNQPKTLYRITLNQ
ncbi:hypothetical protein ACOIPX_001059 [Salmonella enterica]|uniref:hypothetical protein n=1 Tax=Salmonella enterica TaxID=28901 RepID=UPI00127F20C0|nr:hypothetical protein [Salmonella enterica]ECE0792542.1 hypothetical protein [Salmonella enterica subsp. diarizonae]EAQ1546735.1 hypothetical protein [Salmonella enterica]EBG6880250.1 hypothetical protein [Salmonella enterica]EBG9219370.1 hypothetical protein [Salmonella enterica]